MENLLTGLNKFSFLHKYFSAAGICFAVLGLSLPSLAQRSFPLLARPQHSRDPKADLIQRAQQISCPEKGPCPSGIVALLIKEKGTESLSTMPFTCHGHYVNHPIHGPVVGLPPHCLPEKLLRQGAQADCSDSIYVIFPRRNRKVSATASDIAFCDRIVEMLVPSSKSPHYPELALIKLLATGPHLSPDHTPLNLAPEAVGFPIKGEVSVVRLSQTSASEPYFEVTMNYCRVSSNSLFGPYFKRHDDSVFHLSPCEIRPSDSGSAVLSADGFLLGMNTGIATGELRGTWQPNFISLNLMDPGAVINPRVYGTNLTCLLIFQRRGCRRGSSSHVEFSNVHFDQIEKELQNWRSQNSDFQWSVIRNGPSIFPWQVSVDMGTSGSKDLNQYFRAVVPTCIPETLAREWLSSDQAHILNIMYLYPEIDSNLELKDVIRPSYHNVRAILRNGSNLFRRSNTAELELQIGHAPSAAISVPISLCQKTR